MKQYQKSTALAVAAVMLFSAAPALAAAVPMEDQYVTMARLHEQAAEGWHETYEAYGRTVTVDIPVQVPRTDAFPALTAALMPASDDAPFYDGFNMLTQGNESFANTAGVFRWDTPSMETKQAASRDADVKGPSRGMEVIPNVARFNELDWDTVYSCNNEATVRDTDEKMKEAMNRFFPDEGVSLMPHWVYGRGGMYQYDQKTDTFSGDPWPYFYAPLIVYFDQVIGGIPLLGTASWSFYGYTGDTRGDEKLFVGGVGVIQELDDIGLTDIYYSMQVQLLKPTGTLADDLPLCGFAKVMDTYAALITAGKLRRVDSLRLGYLAWQGEDDSFTLLPVWAAEGELFQTAEAGYKVKPARNAFDTLEYGQILVNAQTGEWMDPWNGEENHKGYVPPAITWDSIGK